MALRMNEIRGVRVYGAVWNDYAEYRQSLEDLQPGRVAVEKGDDYITLSNERLLPGGLIVSDTYGSIIGEQDIENEYSIPIAVSGRVLAYKNPEEEENIEIGAAVCTGPNGTVSIMTREEIVEYPERIIGTISSKPNTKVWGTGNVSTEGRIWIRVR